jgi:hypothetical protein
VGTTRTGKTLIVHWNGRSWRRQASPSPGGAGTLSGVAATSAGNAWAVGATGTGRALILHGNRHGWRPVPAPTPGSGSTLAGVAVLTTRNAWAVGSYYTARGTRTLIVHWNGRIWRRVSSPVGALSAVVATSGRNAWAVGSRYSPALFASRSQILHWNGTSWKRVASPGPVGNGAGLQGVAAVSRSRAMAVGCSGCAIGGSANSLIERWSGGHWTKSASAHPPGGDLFAVAMTSAQRAWAVGGHYAQFGNSFDIRTLIERWNGSTWTPVATPSPGTGASLRGVAVVSAKNAWAVGSYQTHAGAAGSERTLILHWNGRAWR